MIHIAMLILHKFFFIQWFQLNAYCTQQRNFFCEPAVVLGCVAVVYQIAKHSSAVGLVCFPDRLFSSRCPGQQEDVEGGAYFP